MSKFLGSILLLVFITPAVSPQSRNRAWLKGTWEGKGYQTDTDSTWPMKMVVRRGRYTIEYPSLNCGGRWKLLSVNSRVARFREHITYGKEECVDRGNVVIERLSRRQLAYRFSNRGAADFTASAILNRKK